MDRRRERARSPDDDPTSTNDKNEINNEIGTEEIKKDIFNDMKLQELELEESEDNDGGK